MLGVVQLNVVSRVLAAVVAVASPLVLIQSIAYLLRVVFPKHPERTPACELGLDSDVPSPPPPAT